MGIDVLRRQRIMAKEKISFIASLPDGTAIKIHGKDGNTKITFDASASELAMVMRLVLRVGETFRVIIEDEKN